MLRKKQGNRIIYFGFILVLTMGIGLISYSDTADIEKLKAKIETDLSGVLNYQITYLGVIHVYPVTENTKEYTDAHNEISQLEKIKDKILSGNLSEQEQREYKKTTIEGIDRCIDSQKSILAGAEIPCIYVYSKNDFKQRVDIIHPENEEENQIYLFDGFQGSLRMTRNNETQMRIGPSLTSRWKSPIGSGGYGFNLDSFVGEDYQINFLENQDQQIKIESPVYLPPNYYFRLTFLEPESSYWKSIELIHENGDIFQRIECDDFRPISGILVPHHLTFLTKGQDGQLSIYQELDLIDATVNTTTFPMNFFDDPDPSEIKHVAIMKR